MSQVDYSKIVLRENLLRRLRECADRTAEEFPQVASVLLGAIIAVKMNRTPELARLVKEFAKSLVDEKSTRKIEGERQEITNLLLKIDCAE